MPTNNGHRMPTNRQNVILDTVRRSLIDEVMQSPRNPQQALDFIEDLTWLKNQLVERRVNRVRNRPMLRQVAK